MNLDQFNPHNIEEVRTDYVCDENLRHIDVYFINQEEGRTAAVICQDTKKVIWCRRELMCPMVQEAIDEALAELKNNLSPGKGLGFTLPKELGWAKMEKIMLKYSAIPTNWRHFMQECDEEIARHFVPEVCECPHCGSIELETGKFDPEGMTTKVECLNCHSEWLDVYKYVGIDTTPQIY